MGSGASARARGRDRVIGDGAGRRVTRQKGSLGFGPAERPTLSATGHTEMRARPRGWRPSSDPDGQPMSRVGRPGRRGPCASCPIRAGLAPDSRGVVVSSRSIGAHVPPFARSRLTRQLAKPAASSVSPYRFKCATLEVHKCSRFLAPCPLVCSSWSASAIAFVRGRRWSRSGVGRLA